MRQDAITKIKKEIRKDGSLSEERKTELLNLLATMIPESIKTQKSSGEYAASMFRSSNSKKARVWKKDK